MKISKLFHWLYAILMLLPVAMFIPTAFYYGFNEHAQAQETTITTENYFQWSNPNQIYTTQQVESNTIYKFTFTFSPNSDYEFTFDYLENLQYNSTEFEALPSEENIGYKIFFSAGDEYLDIYILETNYYVKIDNFNTAYTFYGCCSNSETLLQFDDLESYGIEGIDLGYEIPNGTNSTTTYTMSITDSMSTAWTNTWSNPLFSWSANGFLIAPFNYITNLFGMPNNSTFSLALNYWLTISIVYLVFDLVMYVPLLAHRWIDKGMVE